MLVLKKGESIISEMPNLKFSASYFNSFNVRIIFNQSSEAFYYKEES